MPNPTEAPSIVAVEGYVCDMLVGILPHEKEVPQPVELSVWLTMPALGIVAEDLTHCHDYRPLLAYLEALPQQQVDLLETLAEATANFCFAAWPLALTCKVSVAKLALLPQAKVSVTREWVQPTKSSASLQGTEPLPI